MTELLPCPFCEGESKLAALRSIDDLRIAERYYIVCLDCGAQTAMVATIAAAIAAWNRRAEYGDYAIGTDDDDRSNPGEYGRNPVTAEDVLRAAAQMRAEVEEMERKLGLDTEEGS